MLFAAVGQCACMAILAGTVYDGSHASGIVATVMLFLFNFFFAIGFLGIAWLCMFPGLFYHARPYADKLVPAEYAPLAIRSRAAALATATNCTFHQNRFSPLCYDGLTK